jgi:hypothetical protein
MMGGVIIERRPEAGVQSRPKEARKKMQRTKRRRVRCPENRTDITAPQEKVRDAELG